MIRRLSEKAILEYLEYVYPNWATFEKIFDGVPVINVEAINLQYKLNRMEEKKLIEIDRDELPYEYRVIRK